MLGRGKSGTDRYDECFTALAEATVGLYVGIINRLAYQGLLERAGVSVAPDAASVLLAGQDVAWKRSEGFETNPAGISGAYAAVAEFTAEQLARPDVSAVIDQLPDPSARECRETFRELDDGLPGILADRNSFALHVWRLSPDARKDRSPRYLGGTELGLLDMSLEETAILHDEGALFAPLGAFGEHSVQHLHHAISVATWTNHRGDLLMEWPLDSSETEPADDSSAVGDEEMRCPDCAETIKAAANVCRYCGYRFRPTP